MDPNTAPSKLFLCIDGGGTKTSVSIACWQSQDKGPSVIGRGFDRSSNYTDVGFSQAVRSIGVATVAALRSLATVHPLSYDWDPAQPQSPAPFAAIWAGLSGVDSDRDVMVMRQKLSELFGLVDRPEMIRVTNDCDLLSGMIERKVRLDEGGCKGGVVLIAGTGSIATAFGSVRKEDGKLVTMKNIGRLGGYGYLLGDEGSAFDVGRQTVKTILEHVVDRAGADQIIAHSSLTSAVLQHFGVGDANNLLGAVYELDRSLGQTEHDRKVRLADISRVVMDHAFPRSSDRVGDRFALDIMRIAAERLSDLLIQLCTIHRLSSDQQVLCLGGGMWAHEAFKELVLDNYGIKSGGHSWACVEIINEPDQVGALALAS